MPYYRCTLADAAGKKTEIVTPAAGEEELLEAYAGGGKFLLAFTEAEEGAPQGKGLFRRRKSFSRELIREFTGIMGALLSGGNTVNTSLELCRVMDSRGTLGGLCELLLEGIRRGEKFAEVLVRCGSSFPPLYRALVGIGEKTGKTAEVFSRLGSYLKTSGRLRSKIGSALLYPVLVLAAALSGSALILIFVMPRMAEIFAVFAAGNGNIAGMDTAALYRPVYLGAALLGGILIGTVTALMLHRCSPGAAALIDRILLRSPFIGNFAAARESLDFFFALELCSSAGMNAASALKEASGVIGNRYYALLVKEVREEVLGGLSLSGAFLSRPVFPPLIGHWLAAGEKTGEAQMVFSQVRNFFEETVEMTTERFVAGLEPVLILLTGLVVLALIVQFVIPLFGLYGAAL
jgi:type II secretory pathway component PulF